MWTYIVSYFDGNQNGMTKSINMSIAYDKLQSASFQYGSDIEGNLAYMFNLQERLVTLGATFDYYQMNRVLMNSLPQTNRFRMLKSRVETDLDHVDTPDKLRDVILILDCAQRAEAVTAYQGGTTSRPLILDTGSVIVKIRPDIRYTYLRVARHGLLQMQESMKL